MLWNWPGHGAFPFVTGVYLLSFLVFWGVRDRVHADDPVVAAERAAEESTGAGTTSRRRRLRAPNAAEQSHTWRDLRVVLQRPSILRFVPAWPFVNTVVGVWFTHSAFQLTGVHHRDQWLTGSFSGSGLGLGVWAVRARLHGGHLPVGTADRHSKQDDDHVPHPGPGRYWICVALYALNHTGHAGGIQTQLLTMAYLVGVVIATGSPQPLSARLADLSEEMATHRGAVMGLYSVILGLGRKPPGGALGRAVCPGSRRGRSDPVDGDPDHPGGWHSGPPAQ